MNTLIVFVLLLIIVFIIVAIIMSLRKTGGYDKISNSAIVSGEVYNKLIDENTRLMTCIENLRKNIHVDGMLNINYDEVRSSVFCDHYNTARGNIKLYCNYITNSKYKVELDKYIPIFVNEICSNKYNADMLGIDDIEYRRAIFTASFSKELFNTFAYGPENNLITVLKENTLEQSDTRLEKYKKMYLYVQEINSLELYEKYDLFKSWVDRIIKKLCGDDNEKFNNLFINPSEPKIKNKLYDTFKSVYILLILSKIYPRYAELINFQEGEKVDKDYMYSTYCDQDGDVVDFTNLYVAFTVFNGFKVEGFINKADVVWYKK